MQFRRLLPAALLLSLTVACGTDGTDDSSTDGPSPMVEAPDVLVVGHRGAMDEGPENTVPGFEQGVESNVDMVEVDVQLSADGVPFLFHDDTPKRTTDVDEIFPDRVDDPITSFTWDELQQLDAGASFGGGYAGTRIPSLDDVALTVGPEVGVDIELKSPENSPGLEQVVADALETDAWAPLVENDLVIVSSFDTDATRAFHDLAPEVPVWPIIDQVPDQEWVESVVDHATGIKTGYKNLTPEVVDWADEAGLGIWVHTVNDITKLADLVDMGVLAIVTDSPWLIAPALGHS